MRAILHRPLRLVLAFALALTVLTAAPSPAEASGSSCRGNVCTFVTSSGTSIQQWRSTGTYPSGYRCRNAMFYVNGGLYRIVEVCGSGQLDAYLRNLTLPTGSQLCNEWVGLNGRPCVRT